MWTTLKHSSSDERISSARSVCCGKATKDEDACIPEAIYLKPGGLYVGRPSARVTTVLGSCVAITMYARESHAAAMCHAVQPLCNSASSSCCLNCAQKYKSVRCAVDEMVRRMKRMDVFCDDLEVKVFGGAALLGSRKGREKTRTVGEQNVGEARRVLAEYGFRIYVMEVGGALGRKVIFDTTNGAVFLKRIESIQVKQTV